MTDGSVVSVQGSHVTPLTLDNRKRSNRPIPVVPLSISLSLSLSMYLCLYPSVSISPSLPPFFLPFLLLSLIFLFTVNF